MLGFLFNLLYLKEMYIFINKRWLFKTFSYKTCCQPLSKFDMFTCLCFTYSVLHSISSVKGGTIFLRRDYISGFLVGDSKGKRRQFSKSGGPRKELCSWYSYSCDLARGKKQNTIKDSLPDAVTTRS